jgi:hypothetical protein
MSDSRRRYRAIKSGLWQLYPRRLTGRMLQRIAVLALFSSGIVGNGSTQLRQVAKKASTTAKVESRIKQLSRWYQQQENNQAIYYLPFVEALLAHLNDVTLVNSGEMRYGWQAAMVRTLFGQQANRGGGIAKRRSLSSLTYATIRQPSKLLTRRLNTWVKHRNEGIAVWHGNCSGQGRCRPQKEPATSLLRVDPSSGATGKEKGGLFICQGIKISGLPLLYLRGGRGSDCLS